MHAKCKRVLSRDQHHNEKCEMIIFIDPMIKRNKSLLQDKENGAIEKSAYILIKTAFAYVSQQNQRQHLYAHLRNQYFQGSKKQI